MEVYRTEKLDFSELSELLNVTVDFLKSFEKEILRRNIKFTSKITAEGTVKAERMALVTIEITNNFEVSVDQVRIRINTPPGTMKKTVSEFFNFSAGMTQKIRFQITPKIKPYCPLEVIIDTGLDSEEFPPFPIMTILEVS